MRKGFYGIAALACAAFVLLGSCAGCARKSGPHTASQNRITAASELPSQPSPARQAAARTASRPRVFSPSSVVSAKASAASKNASAKAPSASVSAASKTDSSALSSAASQNAVVFSIDASNLKGYGVLAAVQSVSITTGDTAYSVLQRVCAEKKLALDASGSPVYVHGVGGVSEFDGGASSGWVYRVNGALPDLSANLCKLKAGDRVEWIYSLDGGKSEGGKS